MSAVLFTNVRVFDGTGSDSFAGEVLVQGNRIEKVARGTRPDRPRAGGTRASTASGMTLMPGMIEGHCHPSFTGVSMPYQLGMIPPEEHTLKTAANAKLLLDSGFTSIYCAASAKPRLDVVGAQRDQRRRAARARACAPPAPRSSRPAGSATSASSICTARASR